MNIRKINSNNITHSFSSKDRGFTIFVAIVITGTLLLVATGIVTISVRQLFLTSSARDSQYAFYAADTGVECALYWDIKNPSGNTAFATSTVSSIHCNQDAANTGNVFNVGGLPTSTFTITFLPKPYCATISVSKAANGSTTIESRGYNTCSSIDPRRVERAVRVTY